MLNLTFDLASFINTLIGAILGGLISAAISYIFFLKGKGLDTLTHWMAGNLGDIFVKQAHPQFFGNSASHIKPIEPPPNNPDVPRLTTIIVSPPIVTAGQNLEILCRVSDECWNFPMASGLVIIDDAGIPHPTRNAEFGYMYASIPVASVGIGKSYKIIFRMHDAPEDGGTPNKNEQSIELRTNA
ncbi:hypothetical protein [Aquabacterium sp. NJ1]|uniref:hypothetical protein n=1 Tax=Aquabacterium sp. NJ1 TaxID=1538295 RepID=UPI001269E444|nr:hypothetical protein [Aquabacterium sp. NJ1]